MATHSSVLAWRTPGMAEPGGLLSVGSHRIGHNWSDLQQERQHLPRTHIPVLLCIPKTCGLQPSLFLSIETISLSRPFHDEQFDVIKKPNPCHPTLPIFAVPMNRQACPLPLSLLLKHQNLGNMTPSFFFFLLQSNITSQINPELIGLTCDALLICLFLINSPSGFSVHHFQTLPQSCFLVSSALLSLEVKVCFPPLTFQSSGKESTWQCRRPRRHRFNPWVRKILWRRAWQPTPVFLPGKSQGQRSLEAYSPRGHKRVGPNLGLNNNIEVHWYLTCRHRPAGMDLCECFSSPSSSKLCPLFPLSLIFSLLPLSWVHPLLIIPTFPPNIEWMHMCPILCNLLDCSPTSSSVLEILQARILEWVAISSSRGSPQPRDQKWVSCVSRIADRFFTLFTIRKAPFQN